MAAHLCVGKKEQIYCRLCVWSRWAIENMHFITTQHSTAQYRTTKSNTQNRRTRTQRMSCNSRVVWMEFKFFYAFAVTMSFAIAIYTNYFISFHFFFRFVKTKTACVRWASFTPYNINETKCITCALFDASNVNIFFSFYTRVCERLFAH